MKIGIMLTTGMFLLGYGIGYYGGYDSGQMSECQIISNTPDISYGNLQDIEKVWHEPNITKALDDKSGQVQNN